MSFETLNGNTWSLRVHCTRLVVVSLSLQITNTQRTSLWDKFPVSVHHYHHTSHFSPHSPHLAHVSSSSQSLSLYLTLLISFMTAIEDKTRSSVLFLF